MSEYSKQRHLEIAIIGNLIQRRLFISLMDSLIAIGIKDKCFTSADTKGAWVAVNNLFKTNNSEWSKSGLADDIEIRSVIFNHIPKAELIKYKPDQFSFEYTENMARKIVSTADMRGFKTMLHGINIQANKCDDADTAMLLTKRMFDEWQRSGERRTTAIDIESVAEVLKQSHIQAREDRIKKAEISGKGLSVPWECLNKCYNGMAVGLHIVAARPSEGKTTVAINISRHWRNMRVKHAFISLDMPIDETVKRYGCLDIQQSYSHMNNGYANLEEIDRFKNAIMSYRDSMYLYDCSELSAVDRAIREAHANGAEAVIIDYLQLIYVTGNSNPWVSIRESVAMLKRIARDLGIRIVLLAQLNRQGVRDGREPELHDIEGGGFIEQAASTVTTIGRDRQVCEAWNENPPVMMTGGNKALSHWLRPVWVDMLKNQTGAIGKFPFVMWCPFYGLTEGNLEGTPNKTNNTHMFEVVTDIDYCRAFN